MTPQFKAVLNRAINLYCQEVVDSCSECGDKIADACDTHRDIVWDVMDHPTRYLKISSNLKVSYLVPVGEKAVRPK